MQVLAVLLSIHFAKRVLEVLFLHNFSGSTGTAQSVGIGLYYGTLLYVPPALLP